MFSRRDFLKTASVGLGALIVPQVLLRARPARAFGSDPVLVTLFLRGAADGLNMVVPHQDPQYYAARPNVGISASSVIDLDGFFGFHPSLLPLMPLYQSGRLAIVHASGSPHETRSHFEAQDFMDFAAPGDRTVRVGWLNRFLSAAGATEPLRAITIGKSIAKALRGPAPSTAVPVLANFSILGASPFRRLGLEAMYAESANPLLGSLASTTFGAVDVLQGLQTGTTAAYPSSPLGGALKDLAAVIKGDIGLRLGTINVPGWDHHFEENETLAPMLADLGSSLSAFAQDLGTDLDRTTVLVMTEFGRRVQENGANGTDHGRGGVMFAMGGSIAGGRILLNDDSWPGLAPENLFEGIDLPVTTDFRDIFAEVLTRHMGLADASPVFPAYSLDPGRYPGLFV